MRISELSAVTGVSPDRLRRYESQGLISSQRQPNGYRVYADHIRKEVVFIDMSRKLGFSLSEIAQHLPRYRSGLLTADEMTDALQAKIREVDAVIQEQRMLRQSLVQHIAWFHEPKKESR